MQSRLLKLSVYTSYGKRNKPISKVKFLGHWAFTKISGTWIHVGRIYQGLCSLGCSNLVCTLHMERGRGLFIFKVKVQGHWAFIKISGTWILVGRIARTMWPRMIKLSIYTSYGKRKEPIHFQGQRSHFKVSGPLQRFWYLDLCGQDIARTMQSLCRNLVCIYGSGGSQVNFKVK